MTKLRNSSSSASPIPSESETKSLVFQKSPIHPKSSSKKQGTYYVYQPAGPNAGVFERFTAFISLIYYKYLLHFGNLCDDKE